MLVEVLESVLGEAHSLLIIRMVFKEFLSRWVTLLSPKNNFSGLSLNIYHLIGITRQASILIRARTHFRVLSNVLLVEALGLLLSVHSRVIPLLDALRVHRLLLTELTLSVHRYIPVVIERGRLLGS